MTDQPTAAAPGDGVRPVRRVPEAVWITGALALLWVAGQPWVRERMGEPVQGLARRLMTTELNTMDATMLQRGYYERLMGVSRLNSQLWEVYMKRPPDVFQLAESGLGRQRADYMGVELSPSRHILSGSAVLTTNRWGMRDQEYEQVKPPGTYRIALTGASTTMGWSVKDDEPFEHVLEELLQRRPPDGARAARFEILNFAVPGYTPPQFVGQVDRMLEFQPDMVMITTQDNDVRRTITRLVDYKIAGLAVPFDSVQRLVTSVTAGAESKVDGERRLRPYAADLLGWMYGDIAAKARAAGAVPVWIYLPGLDRVPDPQDKAILVTAAERAGFTILDLSDVYDGQSREQIIVAGYDFHPNALGHRIVGRRLHDDFRRRPELFAPRPAGR